MSDSKFTSIRDLFARSQRDLLRVLTRRVGRDHAPDLLQEAFLRVLHRNEAQEIADPAAYLRRTAVNLAIDFSRRRKAETTFMAFCDVERDAPCEEALPDQRVDSDQRSRLLAQAIEALPPKCRQVFVMRMHEDVSQDEIARRLGISRNMVDRHLRIAIQRCRSALS